MKDINAFILSWMYGIKAGAPANHHVVEVGSVVLYTEDDYIYDQSESWRASEKVAAFIPGGYEERADLVFVDPVHPGGNLVYRTLCGKLAAWLRDASPVIVETPKLEKFINAAKAALKAKKIGVQDVDIWVSAWNLLDGWLAHLSSKELERVDNPWNIERLARALDISGRELARVIDEARARVSCRNG